jgi:hypothetical protein
MKDKLAHHSFDNHNIITKVQNSMQVLNNNYTCQSYNNDNFSSHLSKPKNGLSHLTQVVKDNHTRQSYINGTFLKESLQVTKLTLQLNACGKRYLYILINKN